MSPAPASGRAPAAEGRWYLRPWLVLPAFLLLIVLATLLAPTPTNPRAGDTRLTTYSTGPMGAGAAYELARRLGWHVARRLAPEPGEPGPGRIHAELAVPAPLGGREAHRLLEDVRAGAGLLLVLNPRSALADSLHLRLGARGSGGVLALASGLAADTRVCADSARSRSRLSALAAVPLWPDGRVHVYALAWTAPPPADTTVLGYSTFDKDARVPAVVAFPYGRGRVVVYSDPDMLRNDVLRVCRWQADVLYVRALEYLDGAGGAAPGRIVFDEYRQGFGRHPGSTSTIAGFLADTAPGRMLAQLIAAALVLLLAAGARPVPPRPAPVASRRSPLEHVDALARAYGRMGATRTAVDRLVHGVRRRVEGAAPVAAQGRSHEEFLAAAAAADASLGRDTALVGRALGRPVSPRELEAVGRALRRIETALSTRGGE